MGPNPLSGTGPAPPSKKQKLGPPVASGRSDTFQQKRAKVHAARAIPAQPAQAALQDGELDLQAFLAAHEFEIRSLEQSMAASKAAGSSRAFQQVPRGLRRRTASHNPKRIPKRLRARARREMAEDNTPLVESRRRKPRTTRARIRAETAKRLRRLASRKRKKAEKKSEDKGIGADDVVSNEPTKSPIAIEGQPPRPKIRQNQTNSPPKPPNKFRKRQINKTWLPTHQWHAKRARMTEPKNPLWRFAIPLTPNEKVYRPTHRAHSERGAIVWDMSYMSTVGLYGNPVGMERVLTRIGIRQETCWGEKGKKWRMGTRLWNGVLSKDMNGERRLICPALVFWNPEPADTNSISQDQKKSMRQVYLRVHPSAFLEVFNELLRLTKMETPRMYIEDLRFEIGSIDLTGPASTETLMAVLTTHGTKGSPTTKHGHLFNSLCGLTNPACLPANSVLGFNIQDPRLKHPPRKMEVPSDPDAEQTLLETVANWPAEDNLQPYGLFDRNARYRASCLPSQRSINARKGKSAPGTVIRRTVADPPIPVVLLAAHNGLQTKTQGTWTLLAPWKCILPIWYSVAHTPLISGFNPKVAGLNENMQVAFERGIPWFPADYLGTDAGAEWELEQRKKRKWSWSRRPKSKRIEWKLLNLGAGRKGELGDGHACDFELLFGLSRPPSDGDNTAEKGPSDDAMDVDSGEVSPTNQAQREAATPSLKLLHDISKSAFKSFLTKPPPPITLPRNAIIRVRLSLLARGVATSCARIYRLPPSMTPEPTSPNAQVPATIPPQSTTPTLPHDLRKQWLSRQPQPPSNSGDSKTTKYERPMDLESRKQRLARELLSPAEAYPTIPPNTMDIGGHPLVPDADDLVGFVTSGSFNLSDGRGVAIGSLAAEKVLPDVRQDAKEGRLCIVRNAGENVGWIARWDVI